MEGWVMGIQTKSVGEGFLFGGISEDSKFIPHVWKWFKNQEGNKGGLSPLKGQSTSQECAKGEVLGRGITVLSEQSCAVMHGMVRKYL